MGGSEVQVMQGEVEWSGVEGVPRWRRPDMTSTAGYVIALRAQANSSGHPRHSRLCGSGGMERQAVGGDPGAFRRAELLPNFGPNFSDTG